MGAQKVRPWFQLRPELLEDVKQTIAADHPDLRMVEEATVSILGTFNVSDEIGVVDRFQVAILFPNDYPDSLPIIVETAGRIPRDPDRHMFTNGAICPVVNEDWQLLAPDRSFKTFMDGPVRNYFLGQSLAEIGKPWPFGERDHGFAGLVDAYNEHLNLADRKLVGRYLHCLSHERIKGHWECPCQSGRNIRDCHRDQISELQKKVPWKLAKSAHSRLVTYREDTVSMSELYIRK